MNAEERCPPLHIVGCDSARTLPGLFRQRVERTPQAIAYRQYEHGVWRDYTWAEMARLVARWQRGLAQEGLKPGDRVALSLRNCVEWVCFDQAALGLGLVPVPIYTTDSTGNMVHILADSGARLLLLDADRPLVGAGPRTRGLSGAAPGAVSDRARARSADPHSAQRRRLAARASARSFRIGWTTRSPWRPSSIPPAPPGRPRG